LVAVVASGQTTLVCQWAKNYFCSFWFWLIRKFVVTLVWSSESLFNFISFFSCAVNYSVEEMKLYSCLVASVASVVF